MRGIPASVSFLVAFAMKRLVCCVVLIVASHYCSHRWGREENRKREGKEKEPTKAQTCQASCWLQSCSCWLVAKKRWVTNNLFIALLLLLTYPLPPSFSLSLSLSLSQETSSKVSSGSLCLWNRRVRWSEFMATSTERSQHPSSFSCLWVGYKKRLVFQSSSFVDASYFHWQSDVGSHNTLAPIPNTQHSKLVNVETMLCYMYAWIKALLH